MLLFSAFLEANEKLDADAFIELAIRCNQENQYDFNRVRGIDWKPGVRTARYGTPDLSLTICEYGDDSLDRNFPAAWLENYKEARRRNPRAIVSLQEAVGKHAGSKSQKNRKNRKGGKKGSGRASSSRGADVGATQLAAIRARLRKSHIVAIRQEKVDKGIHWQTDYILNLSQRSLQIQLSRTFRSGTMDFDRDFSTPWFISFLIDGGYLEPDGEMPIRKRPTVVTADTLDMFGGIVQGRHATRLPLVYVSRTDDGDLAVNADLLASQLKGVAHVFTEESHDMDAAVAQACGERLATGGALTILWPRGDTGYEAEERPVPRHVSDDVRGGFLADTVRRRIFAVLRQEDVFDEFTWDGVNALIAQTSTERLEKQYDSASNELEQARRRLDASSEKLRQQRDATSRLSADLAESRDKLDRLSERVSRQEGELDEQKRQNAEKDEKLRRINQETRRDDDERRKLLAKAEAEQQELIDNADESLAQQKELLEQERERADRQNELVDQLRRRVRQLTQQVEGLRDENERMARRFANGAVSTPLVYAGGEHDLFSGEMRDYVLEAVKHELDGCGHGDSKQSWRKVDVLSDVLESNDYEGLHEQRREELRRALVGYRGMTAQLEATLDDLGYKVIRGDRHYILEYCGDARYRFTLAKTPSDVHAGDNSATKIARLTQ